MAKQTTTSVTGSFKKPKKKRPGIHSKSKSSKMKQSKHYLKKSVGQN